MNRSSERLRSTPFVRRARELRTIDPGFWTPFQPAWWLPGRHLQTTWSRLFRRGPIVAYRRETWETPDGDVLELDWIDGPSGSPLLLALHGLEGCSQSLYMQGILTRAAQRGWRGLALNFRSCASPPRRPRGEWVLNRRPRLYHSGDTADLDWVVRRLMEREPDLRLVLSGVSLGGNVLLKWLGEQGDRVRETVVAAAAISAPHDVGAASRYLATGLGPFYVRFFLESLKRKAIAFDARWPGMIDLDAALRARTFTEFDGAVIAPLHGFRDAADYYERSSAIGYVDRIQVPTVIINAADDPFIPGEVLPRVRERASESVTCVFTRKGAHAGFAVGPPWETRCWAEDRAVDFLADRL